MNLFLSYPPYRRPELLKGVLAMEYKEPSKIQKTALPALLMNPYVYTSIFSFQSLINCFFSFRPQNMIAHSQSGTGKTAAFVLAMLNRADTSKNYPHVVCLSPTFELAIEICPLRNCLNPHCADVLTLWPMVIGLTLSISYFVSAIQYYVAPPTWFYMEACCNSTNYSIKMVLKRQSNSFTSGPNYNILTYKKMT